MRLLQPLSPSDNSRKRSFERQSVALIPFFLFYRLYFIPIRTVRLKIVLKIKILYFRVTTKSENGDDLMLSCGNEYSEPINAYVLPDSRTAKLRTAR